MKVENIHQRIIPKPLVETGPLLDSLSSNEDRLWPEGWPPMIFDKPLQVGAAGGHGPIRYFVEAYDPGRSIRFRFTGPKGFDGYHAFYLQELQSGHTTFRHEVIMDTSGFAQVTWPFFFRWLHDALVEEAFDKAERQLGITPVGYKRNIWVRFLRGLLKLRKRR